MKDERFVPSNLFGKNWPEIANIEIGLSNMKYVNKSYKKGLHTQYLKLKFT